MASPAEDPELDFTNYMEEQKSNIKATAPQENNVDAMPPAMSRMMLRGTVFFGILLALLGVLIFLYMNKPDGARYEAPEGYLITDPKNGPPKLQKKP